MPTYSRSLLERGSARANGQDLDPGSRRTNRLDARVPRGAESGPLRTRSAALVLGARTQRSHSDCCGVHLVCFSCQPVETGCWFRSEGPVDLPSLAGRVSCRWCCPVGRVGSRAGDGLTRSLSVGRCSGLTEPVMPPRGLVTNDEWQAVPHYLFAVGLVGIH